MKKLYGVVVLNKEQFREVKLNSILNGSTVSPDNGEYNGDFLYLVGKDSTNITTHDQMYLSWGRTYKTISGAKKFYDSLLKCKDKIKGSYKTKVDFDESEHLLAVADITDSWNTMIGNLIKKEIERHSSEIEKLKSRYLINKL
jgi:hypothetical protein